MQRGYTAAVKSRLDSHWPIRGERIFLRPLREPDASATYAQWLNDEEVNRYLETRSVTLAELRTYIEEKHRNPQALLLGIFWSEDGSHIGNVKLEPIDFQEGDAVIGILIGDKRHWGKGVATETVDVVCTLAFDILKLQSLTLGVIPENAPAIRVYEKCGFHTVRTERDALNHDGVLHDRIVMRKEAPKG